MDASLSSLTSPPTKLPYSLSSSIARRRSISRSISFSTRLLGLRIQRSRKKEEGCASTATSSAGRWVGCSASPSPSSPSSSPSSAFSSGSSGCCSLASAPAASASPSWWSSRSSSSRRRSTSCGGSPNRSLVSLLRSTDVMLRSL